MSAGKKTLAAGGGRQGSVSVFLAVPIRRV